MTYAERIKAIANAIHLMGGVCVYFKDKGFCFAQERTYFYKSNKRMMWLKEITPNDLIFCEDFGGTLPPQFEMPIDDFSEKFLANVYATYVKECREQLTDYGYEKIRKFVEKIK